MGLRPSDTNRLVYWGLGGLVLGALLSIVIAVIIVLIAYYPIGTYLPDFGLHSFVFALLGLIGLAGVFGLCGLVLAAVRRSWRPIGLAVAAIIGLVAGVYPADWVYDSMLWQGYELLSARSAKLIAAIENYERANGRAPGELAQLIPEYIDSIPSTGVPRSPHYDYADGASLCSAENGWELSVPAGDFIVFDTFFYCPLRDYAQRFKIVGSWAYCFD